MQEANKKRTESIIGAWNKTPTGMTDALLQNYKEAYKSITNQVEKSYSRVLSGIEPEKYYSEMTKFNRLTNLQKSIASDYTTAAMAAGKAQFEISQTALSNIYYGNMYSVNWFSGGYFSELDKKIMEVSVYGTEEIWQSIKAANRATYEPYLPRYGTLSSLLEANAVTDLKRINQSITQGLRKGDSYNTIARDLGRIFNTTASNAIRIVRTEGNRNMNAGAFAQSQAASDAGIEMQRMYLATLDTRTREQSGAMDGQRRPIDKPFQYGGLSWFIPGNSGNPAYDINDRCSVIDIVDNSPPELRRGRNPVTGQTEVAGFTSFNGWMKKNNLTRNNSGRIVFKG